MQVFSTFLIKMKALPYLGAFDECLNYHCNLILTETMCIVQCALRLRVVIAALPLSRRIVGFDIITLQLSMVFKIKFFNCIKSSRIYLDVLEVASMVPT